jgi:PIN domain nuclease of toxin-antitoxin system
VGKAILDASALLAFIKGEPGQDVVREALRSSTCVINTANLSEAAAKLILIRPDPVEVRAVLAVPGLDVVAVGEEEALLGGDLAIPGKALGLSLGDRLCMASAIVHQAEALTTDSIWARMTVPGLKVRIIR